MNADPPPDEQPSAEGELPQEPGRAVRGPWDGLAETKPSDLGDPQAAGEPGRGGSAGARPAGKPEKCDADRRLVNGRYRLVAVLHAGGMGITYRAWDTQAKVPVVVKMPKPQVRGDREATARFQREIDAMRAVPHASIVPITDSGDDDGCPFVVMRLLPGGSLADYRRRDDAGNPLRNPPGMLHFWLPGVAAALDHIHSRGMLHRDVKPANIFLDGFLRPFLGDFGIAKVVDDSGGLAKEETLTAPKEAMGTPEYMAPELFRPKPQADGRMDQYALAITVYEMLAGTRPFTGTTHHIILEHTSLPVPPLAARCPGLPESLRMAVERALSKQKEMRFATCSEFAAAALAQLRPLEPEADTVRLLCPSCRNILKLSQRTAGRRGRCPRCQSVIDVAADLGSLWLDQEERDEPLSAAALPMPEVLPEKIAPRKRRSGAWPGRWVAGLTMAALLVGLAVGALSGAGRSTAARHDREEAAGGRGAGASAPADQVAAPDEPPAAVEPRPGDAGGELAVANEEIAVLEASLAEVKATTATQATRLDALLAENARLRQLLLATRQHDQTAAAEPLAERFANSIAMQLVLIPAGEFTMGDEEGEWDESPAHRVTIPQAFFMGAHEVTNAQWEQVMGDLPSIWKDDDRPVEQVSWQQAGLFCTRLSALPAETDAGRRYRLPTEAEWEYACRAGTRTRFSFGNEEASLGDFAWFLGTADDQTHPVGRRKPNPWGLHDIHGNVAEWCSDRHGAYTPDPLTNPTGPAVGDGRVIRGGGWNAIPDLCRSARRDIGESPSGAVGFRVVMERR